MKISQINVAASCHATLATPKIRQKSKFSGTNLRTLTKHRNSTRKRSSKTPQKAPKTYQKAPQSSTITHAFHRHARSSAGPKNRKIKKIQPKPSQLTENTGSAPKTESHESHRDPFETHAKPASNPSKWLLQPLQIPNLALPERDLATGNPGIVEFF